MQSLAEILKAAGRRYSLGQMVELHRIRRAWRRIVGENLLPHTFAHHLEDGLLTINVDSSPWLTELKFLEREILLSAQKITGIKLKELRLRVGTLPRASLLQELTE